MLINVTGNKATKSGLSKQSLQDLVVKTNSNSFGDDKLQKNNENIFSSWEKSCKVHEVGGDDPFSQETTSSQIKEKLSRDGKPATEITRRMQGRPNTRGQYQRMYGGEVMTMKQRSPYARENYGMGVNIGNHSGMERLNKENRGGTVYKVV